MNYNFDEIINRNGTDSVKWDGVEGRWGRNDLIPMWVADMDFRTAPFVIEALKKRLEQLPDVAMVDISGMYQPEMYILPDEAKMKSLNITQDQLKEAIDQNNRVSGS